MKKSKKSGKPKALSVQSGGMPCGPIKPKVIYKLFNKAFIAYLAFIAVLSILYYLVFKPPFHKFEVGDCLLNRAYETAMVDMVYPYTKRYGIRRTTIAQSSTGWFMVPPSDGSNFYFIDVGFADKTYTKVPCSSIDF